MKPLTSSAVAAVDPQIASLDVGATFETWFRFGIFLLDHFLQDGVLDLVRLCMSESRGRVILGNDSHNHTSDRVGTWLGHFHRWATIGCQVALGCGSTLLLHHLEGFFLGVAILQKPRKAFLIGGIQFLDFRFNHFFVFRFFAPLGVGVEPVPKLLSLQRFLCQLGGLIP
ncbi:AAEL006745-PA [Aedes aegypti]|uniref:AAEL006745-PA n=1 Tax=Aedes aegypti TaxID=7159 RepID=Q174Z1_AEDAE|nr:AAEL006745-PA [Aedes aegypti]